jgi:PAS domain S-box-containing protein
MIGTAKNITWNMESQEGSDALFKYAAEGILVIDEDGFIRRVNPSAERLFGYMPGELIGKKIEVLVPRDKASKHESYRTQFNGNPHARAMGKGLDLHALRKDGTEFPVEISLSPYSTAEGRYVIAFIVDISLRKRAEENLKNYSAELEKQVRNRTLILEEAIDQLEKTKSELNIALSREKDLNELKSRFVSMASHEFRTPLATIMSSLALVKKYGELSETEKQHKHINRIKSAINNLTDILNDFLSVSKLEEGKVSVNPEEFELTEFIGDIIKELETVLKPRQTITYHHEGPSGVVMDQKLLKNILFNLVSNAIKFSDEGKTVGINTKLTDKEVIISVKDEGIGISAQDQKHLFERFFRGQNAINIQGTGLGLSIVAKYVELMRGTVEVDSRINSGTTIRIIFNR